MLWSISAVALLVLPRVFIFPVAETGVRIEDIILLVLFPSAVRLIASKELGMATVIRPMKIYYAIVVSSSLLAGLAGRVNPIVTLAFGLRPLLYLSAFVIGYRLGLRRPGGRQGVIGIASIALFAHVGYGVALVFDIVPNVASFDASRLSGITNGPYELSAIAALVFVVTLASRQVCVPAVGFLTVLWTQSRIALAALLMHTVLFAGSKRGLLYRVAVLGTVGLLALAVIETRSGTIEISDTFAVFTDLREDFSEAARTQDDYFTAVYSEEANAAIMASDGDPSALLRIARWSMVIATTVHDVPSVLVGMGPGYYSVALDGNYVRLVGETGVLGMTAFLLFLIRIPKTFQQDKVRRIATMLVLQLSIIAVFFDIFVSLKVMCLFWMILGALKREELQHDA